MVAKTTMNGQELYYDETQKEWIVIGDVDEDETNR